MVQGFKRKDKTDRNRKIMVYFMAFIMVGSVFGVIFFGYGQQENKVKFNDFSFVQKEGLWFTNIDGREAVFNYLPDEVADINLENDVSGRLSNIIEIDVTSEFNSSFKEYIALAEHQMALTLTDFNIYVRTGFTGENEFGMPVITCEDSTLNVPVIYFKESNETKIYLQNNCIIAEARNGFDSLRIKDKLLYVILGILNE
jgi:hypothetical protein